jgi:hypothetical protein
MYMTLKVLPHNETFVITDPFRIAEEIAAGLDREGTLDSMLHFVTQCRRGLSGFFGDTVLFVSFSDAFLDEPEGQTASAAPFRDFFPSQN